MVCAIFLSPPRKSLWFHQRSTNIVSRVQVPAAARHTDAPTSLVQQRCARRRQPSFATYAASNLRTSRRSEASRRPTARFGIRSANHTAHSPAASRQCADVWRSLQERVIHFLLRGRSAKSLRDTASPRQCQCARRSHRSRRRQSIPFRLARIRRRETKGDMAVLQDRR